MTDISREGGCGCGKVRYRVQGEPIMVHNCHCRQCQQQTGGTSVFNAFWESDAIIWIAGDFEEAELQGGSGRSHVIRRCSRCGMPVVSYYGRFERLMSGVRAATLDDPTSVTPDCAIFTEERLPWVTLPEGIPHFARFYDAREVLSADSVERLRVLVERRNAEEA